MDSGACQNAASHNRCLLLALEVGKQGVSLGRGYDLYHLPFHFCSLFIFMLPLMAFYQGRHKQTVFAVTPVLCAALFLLMLIYPNLIYSAGNINHFFDEFLSFHTVAFHNIVMLAFVLIVALRLHVPTKTGEQKAIIFFTIGFCIVAATMSQLLKTNYGNFYSCNIPVFEALRTSMQGVLGYGLTQLIYVGVLVVLHILFLLGAYWFYRLLCAAAGKGAAAATD